MRSAFLGGVFLTLTACQPRLDVSVGAQIACTTSANCPSTYVCHEALGLCLPPGATPPKQGVAFVQPSDGATSVSTTITLVVAFTWPVDLATATGHTSLLRPDGTPVALNVTASPKENILFVQPTGLESLTRYTLVFSPGIAVSLSGLGLPTDEEVRLAFVTAEQRDQLPPTPLAAPQILIDRQRGDATNGHDDRVTLSWSNPDTQQNPDLSGTLILRKKNGPLVLDPTATPNDLPLQGLAYAAGKKLHPGETDSAEVAAVVTGTSASLVDLDPAAAYDFAFLWFDVSSNYSEPRRTPFVTATSLLWCPSPTPVQQGSFRLTSADPGSFAALLWDRALPAGTPPLQIPNASVPMGTEVTFLGADVTLGHTYDLRFSARGTDGESLGPPQPFVASPADLAPLRQVGAVGHPQVSLNSAIESFGFSAFAWPGFEVEIDSDPVAGAETWSSAPPVTPVNGRAAAPAPTSAAGSFKVRVRPSVPGCASAPWVESAEYQVGGGVRYVSAPLPGGLGSDTNDGLTRETPFATIGMALSVADGTNDLDVLVSEGTYLEGLFLRSHVRLFGGYSPDFQTRDTGPRESLGIRDPGSRAPAHETRVTGTLDCISPNPCRAVVLAPPFTHATILDGLTFAPGAGASTNVFGVYLDDGLKAPTFGPQYSGAAVTLRNNRIFSAASSSAGGRTACIYSRCDATQLFEGNDLIARGSNAPEDYAIYTECAFYDSLMTVANNRIRATKGVEATGGMNDPGGSFFNTLVMVGNRVEGRDEADAPSNGATVSLEVAEAGRKLDIHDNLFLPDRPALAATSDTTAISLTGGFGTIEHNLIEGGHYGTHSLGISLSDTMAAGKILRIVNNVISPGAGASSRVGILDGENWMGEFVVTHNTFVGVDHRAASPYSFFFISYYPHAGGRTSNTRVVNNLFLGRFDGLPSPAVIFSGADYSIGPVQNNVVVAVSNLALCAGPFIFGFPDFEAKYCSATGNLVTSTSAAELFGPSPDADDDWTTLGDSHWQPLASAAGVLSIGVDTTQLACTTNTAAICTGTPTAYCGAVTDDFTGAARTFSPPAVGAFEPR